MLRNYLKIAFRNITGNPLFSAINIIGLSIGLACCISLPCSCSMRLRMTSTGTTLTGFTV